MRRRTGASPPCLSNLGDLNNPMRALQTVRAILPLINIYPWAMPTVILIGILSSLAGGLSLSLFIPFLHSLMNTPEMTDTTNWWLTAMNGLFADYSRETRITFISLTILSAIFMQSILAYANRVLTGWLQSHISHRLRSGIFDQVMTVSHRFLEKSDVGRILNALITETVRTSDAIIVFLVMVSSLCTVIVYIALLFVVSWQLALVFFLLAAAVGGIVLWLAHRSSAFGHWITEANKALSKRMIEGVEGINVIRAFGREDYERERFERNSKDHRNFTFKKTIFIEMVSPIYEIFASLLMVIILLSSGHFGNAIPELIVFIFIMLRLAPNIKAAEMARVRLSTEVAAVRESSYLLERTNKPYVHSGSVPFDGLRSQIEFRDVAFKYGNEHAPALDDISVAFPRGKTTALVGASGAGKSTVIKLLLRFYDPTSGQILVDGTPLEDLDLKAWRQRIAIVEQTPYCFNASIRDNIAYGRPGATEEEIIEAAKLARAHEFIVQFNNGYDTEVGDRGVRLSGGQKQRLTIARAFIRDPDFLILDEATNALDAVSEHLIQSALEELSRDRTVVVVAHRLSTIERADNIVVLDRGKIVEQGSISSLKQQNGHFGRLYRLQFQDGEGLDLVDETDNFAPSSAQHS